MFYDVVKQSEISKASLSQTVLRRLDVSPLRHVLKEQRSASELAQEVQVLQAELERRATELRKLEASLH